MKVSILHKSKIKSKKYMNHDTISLQQLGHTYKLTRILNWNLLMKLLKHPHINLKKDKQDSLIILNWFLINQSKSINILSYLCIHLLKIKRKAIVIIINPNSLMVFSHIAKLTIYTQIRRSYNHHMAHHVQILRKGSILKIRLI